MLKWFGLQSSAQTQVLFFSIPPQDTEISRSQKRTVLFFGWLCGFQVPNSQFSILSLLRNLKAVKPPGERKNCFTNSKKVESSISRSQKFLTFFLFFSYSSIQNKFQKYVYNAKISYFSDLNSDMLFKNLSERESERKIKKKKLARWIRIQ